MASNLEKIIRYIRSKCLKLLITIDLICKLVEKSYQLHSDSLDKQTPFMSIFCLLFHTRYKTVVKIVPSLSYDLSKWIYTDL